MLGRHQRALTTAVQNVREAFDKIDANVSRIQASLASAKAKEDEQEQLAVQAAEHEEQLTKRIQRRKRLVNQLRSVFVDARAPRLDTSVPWLTVANATVQEALTDDDALRAALNNGLLDEADEGHNGSDAFVDETIAPTAWCVVTAYAVAVLNDFHEFANGESGASGPKATTITAMEAAADCAWRPDVASMTIDRVVASAGLSEVWQAMPAKAALFLVEFGFVPVCKAYAERPESAFVPDGKDVLRSNLKTLYQWVSAKAPNVDLGENCPQFRDLLASR
jgi:hypothetical protein